MTRFQPEQGAMTSAASPRGGERLVPKLPLPGPVSGASPTHEGRTLLEPSLTFVSDLPKGLRVGNKYPCVAPKVSITAKSHHICGVHRFIKSD
ncbi:hypothetical protein NP493_5g00034 [Ridgeia piscesae]|uniref:Uncharacterized protein n=1 Tax=Ridgeia piscesae TaxID=27915 RepID=A0AAD9PFL1_RIDPI|nr:hypothetical protein NP493_5g00034 [Ridgeia piscesae]